MPHVTVTLKYTPKPEGEAVAVCEGMRVYRNGDSVFILDEGSGLYGTDQHIEVPIAYALSLARALALVAGCADPRWRGGHWEAREQNGRLLATTPLGEWYVNQDDCLKAIRTMFGYGVRVVLDYGSGGDESPLLRFAGDIHALAETIPVPTDTSTNYCPDSSLLNFAAAHLAADDTPEADQ